MYPDQFYSDGLPSFACLLFRVSRQETSSDGSGCFLLAHPPPPADWPQNSMEYNRRRTFDHFKVTNIVKVHEANFPAVGSDSDQADAAWPTGVVWLMVRCQSMLVLSVYSFDIDITHHNCIICQSFPNSGTTYTMSPIRGLTNTTTATNYGKEHGIEDEDSVPAFKGDDGINGPILDLITNRTTSLPKLILTKTHCSGYSRDPTENIVATPRSFLMSCLTGSRCVHSSELIPVRYSKDLVVKP